jgi:hypothetical protein
MQRRRTDRTPSTDHDDDRYDLGELLHPANAFAHPSGVVNDPDLTLSEKRAILTSWASDACAVEAFPAVRRRPGNRAVAFDDIMHALRELDRQAGQPYRPHYKHVLADRRPGVFGRKSQKSADARRPSLN